MAVGIVAHIEAKILDAGHMEIPFIKRLLVHGADVGETLLLEIQGEVAGDESARAGDDDQVILLQRRVFFYNAFLVFHNIFVGLRTARPSVFFKCSSEF